jgi:hypothetical protein
MTGVGDMEQSRTSMMGRLSFNSFLFLFPYFFSLLRRSPSLGLTSASVFEIPWTYIHAPWLVGPIHQHMPSNSIPISPASAKQFSFDRNGELKWPLRVQFMSFVPLPAIPLQN